MPGKSKLKKLSNKKATGTGINTPMIIETSDKHVSTNAEKNKDQLYDLDTFEGLEQKTKELKDKLDKINSDFEKEKKLVIQDTSKLNEDIENKCLELNELLTKNKKIISKFKEIKSTLDDKMKNSKKLFKKIQKLKQNEPSLEEKIITKEKEIKVEEKNKNIIIKDINLLEKNNDPQKQNELKTKLEQLEKEHSLLENYNIELKKILKEHKLCQKLKQSLNNKLNLMTNEYEFEVKKSSMYDSNIFDVEEKKEKIKKEKDEKVELNNRSVSFGYKIREEILEKMKKKKSEAILVSERASHHISNLCNSIEEQYKKKSGDLQYTINNDYQTKQKKLFNEDEQVHLSTIIPSNYLNEYRERFNALENQRLELIERVRNQQNLKNKKFTGATLKLNYTDLKKKQEKFINIDLKSKVVKKKTNISKLKIEINKIDKELKNLNKLLKVKNNDNIKLTKYIENLEKNKKSKIKNVGEKINNEEEEYDNNLDYNMEE